MLKWAYPLLKMRFFVLPIFSGAIMDEYLMFWVVDAGVAGIHQ